MVMMKVLLEAAIGPDQSMRGSPGIVRALPDVSDGIIGTWRSILGR